MPGIFRGFTAAPPRPQTGYTPARRVRLRGVRLLNPAAALLTASLCGCTLSLFGCGSSTSSLHTVTVERAIASSILAQRQLYATVSCPSKVPQKAGFAFTCTAHLNIGTYPVSVTETNNSGHVRYQNRTTLVTLDVAGVQRAIAQSILSQRGLHSTVTCPAEVIQKAGITFTCVATVNGRRYPFAVTEVDDHGHVRYVGH
jgi:Domain of unknown function (DUF4333)